MTLEQVAQMVEGIGIPYAYYEFTNNVGVAPPFITYYYDENTDLIADNINYCRINSLVIELYTDNKNFALERAIETALNANELVYKRQEEHISSERMYMVTFRTSVIITEEENNV